VNENTEVPIPLAEALTPEEAAEAPAHKLYELTLVRDETSHPVLGRERAVGAAKRISRERREPVEVLRRDGRVRMRFFGGALENYLYETRPNRRA
jgi:hypothetical protein